VAGAVTVTAGLVVLVYGIVRTESYGWTSARTLATLAVALLLLAVFGVLEGRIARAPLVPLRIFGSRQLTGANLVVFFLGSAVFAMWYFVSLYLQEVLGFTPLEAGVSFAPMSLTIVAASSIAGRAVTRIGAGPLLAVGMGLIAAGMALFSGVAVHGSYLGDVLLPALVTAAGIGMSFVPVTIAAVSGVAPQEAGLASGLVNTSRQVGGSLGLAALATLATQRTADVLGGGATTPAALTAGFHRAFLLGAGFAAAGALAALVLIGRVRPGRRGARAREAGAEAQG
jgi:predicted MFS family arabinose efflux permease